MRLLGLRYRIAGATLARRSFPRASYSPLPTQSHADAAGQSFAAAVGCGSGATDVASCLRAVPTMVAEQTAGVGYLDGGHGTVAPTIKATTLKMTLRPALTTGHVNKVQVIAGADRDENLVGFATTAAEHRSLVETQYGAHASQVLARYPLNRFDSPASLGEPLPPTRTRCAHHSSSTRTRVTR